MGALSCRGAWPVPWSGSPLALATAANGALNAAFSLALTSTLLRKEGAVLASAVLMILGGALLLVAGGREAAISGKSLILRYGLMKRVVDLSDVVELSNVGELSGFKLARHVPGLLIMVVVSVLSGWIALYWVLSAYWRSPLALLASLTGSITLQHALTVMAMSPGGGRRRGAGHLVSIAAGLTTLATSAFAPDSERMALIVLGGIGLLFSLAFFLTPGRVRKLLLIGLADGSRVLVVGDEGFRRALVGRLREGTG